jgi:dihydroneopterin aldolase
LDDGSFYFVRVREIEADASIGIHQFEQIARQRFKVSVLLILPKQSHLDDDIASVLDYDFVRNEVLEMAESKHWQLQETFCRALAQRCCREDGVWGAIVQSEKPDVYPDTAGVGCRIAVLSPHLPSNFEWWAISV